MALQRKAVVPRLIGVVTAVCMLWSTCGPATAAVLHDVKQAKAEQAQQDLIKLFDPYVNFDAKLGYSLRQAPSGASKEDLARVQGEITKANTVLKTAQAAVESGLAGLSVQIGRETVIGFTVPGGENKIVRYWYGEDWYMNQQTTRQMSYGLRTAANASVVLGLLMVVFPPAGGAAAVALVVAAALFYWGADTLDYVNQGNGVAIRLRFGFAIGMVPQ